MGKLRLVRPDAPPLEVASERATLGREASCELHVDDRSVSRRHATIERRGDEWFVVDQGSANGTRLDGRRVAEAPLRDGQKLKFGTVSFRVEIEVELAGTILMAAPPLDLDKTHVMAAPEVEPRHVPKAPPVVAPKSPAAAAPAPPAEPIASAELPVDPRGRAAALLGVAAAATSWEVKARYDTLAHDLEAKIASAQTPHLRRTWQKNLDELREAVRVLAPDVLFEYSVSDLPSAQPIVVAERVSRPPTLPSAPTPAFAQEPAREPRAAGGLPFATTLLVGASMVMVAIMAFFSLSISKSESAIRKRENDPDLIQGRETAARLASIETLLRSGALENHTLRLCNRTRQRVDVAWLGAVYVKPSALPADADKALVSKASGFELATYNSAFCAREFELTLGPGEERAVRATSQDPRCAWDGSVLFWSLAVQRAGQVEAAADGSSQGGTLWLSGLGRNGCVALEGGW